MKLLNLNLSLALIACLFTLIVSGCTTYDIKRDSAGIISVQVKSTRSFEAPDLAYEREGEDVKFEFKAANADNNTDAFVGMFSSMMQQMMSMMQMMAVPVE